MKKIKVKYVGTYPIMLRCPGFDGDVLPGEEIEILEEALPEFIGHDNWEILNDKKVKKDARGDE